LTFDSRQLERILADTDCRDLAYTLAHWLAEMLVHAAAHGCNKCPIQILRDAGVRFAHEEESAA
jgi:hypothetical protein